MSGEEFSPRTKIEFLYREVLGEVDSIVARLEVAGKEIPEQKDALIKASSILVDDLKSIQKEIFAANKTVSANTLIALDNLTSEVTRLRLSLKHAAGQEGQLVKLKIVVAFLLGSLLPALYLYIRLH